MKRIYTISIIDILLCLCLCMCGCNHKSKIYSHKTYISRPIPFNPAEKETIISTHYKEEITPEEPPPITIWIHGTLLLKKSFFYTYFDGVTGLKCATELMKQPKYPGKIAYLMAKNDPSAFPLNSFYFFGWTGKLDDTERLHAAYCLQRDLQKLIQEYQQAYLVYPKITIISHSHGGNIALYLPFIAENSAEKPKINSLILLACPVQRKTMPFIYDSMFEKIYALYSSLDMIQVLAPQHPYYRPFSSKEFPKNEKMVQARIKINGHALLHTSFSKQHFMGILPTILTELKIIHQKMNFNSKLADKEIVMNVRMQSLCYK